MRAVKRDPGYIIGRASFWQHFKLWCILLELNLRITRDHGNHSSVHE